MGCIVSDTGYLAHRINKGEIKGTGNHTNNRKRGVSKIVESNVGMNEKSSKQGLTSAKIVSPMFPWERGSLYHALD